MTGDAITDGASQTSGRRLLQVLGPGLITGAADDDPSGIATYSQVGAQFGCGLAWTLVFSYPLMTAIQEISARIGRVTGLGIAGNLRRYYSAWLSFSIVLLLLIANLINLGADLGAMGAALKLMVGGPALAYVVLFALLSSGLQIFTRYKRYTSILKWDAWPVCLRDLRFRRRCIVGQGGLGDRLAPAIDQCGLFDGDRRGVRHHDQPLFILLAGRPGGRGS